MDHYEMARAALAMSHQQPQSEVITAYASQATGHAVLALIDIITSDRETEIQDANQRITELENERTRLRRDIGLIGIENDELREQLAGAYDTVRRHEQAAANEKAATNNDLRKSYE